MSANVVALASVAPSSVCLVCTERDRGAPLCDACLVAISDAVPPFADLDVRSLAGRMLVRREVARAVARARDDAIYLDGVGR